ncbi:hypothetical protein DQ237_15475 [Blastococcus sp. TF02-8]|uniref:hypothetical protein n=1 Tax=Blastococcus sp. TF02-8 TaxID=2250574 RepID=UPI000DEB61DC|nr:hypothetical protein [Blastococcus sp. TF02-8]RBY95103.1 hypothetical protein DQ237_15475 [Blastococcus sp. TF02-8]
MHGEPVDRLEDVVLRLSPPHRPVRRPAVQAAPRRDVGLGVARFSEAGRTPTQLADARRRPDTLEVVR